MMNDRRNAVRGRAEPVWQRVSGNRAFGRAVLGHRRGLLGQPGQSACCDA